MGKHKTSDLVDRVFSEGISLDRAVEEADLWKPYDTISFCNKMLSEYLKNGMYNPGVFQTLVNVNNLANARAEDLDKKIRKSRKEARALSMKDELTGLTNRRGLNSELKKEFAFAYRNPDRIFSVAAFDIDNFKNFNEHYGHIGGDSVLKTLSHIVSSNTRGSDSVFRIGGDEFCILYRDASAMKALVSVYKLSRQLADTKKGRGGKRKEPIEISAGITEINKQNPIWLLYGAGGCQLVKDYVGGNSDLEREIKHYIDRYSIERKSAMQRDIPDEKKLRKDIGKIGDFVKDYIAENNLDVNDVPVPKIAVNWTMKNADDLAYHAKRNGKNCVAYNRKGKNVIYTPE